MPKGLKQTSSLIVISEGTSTSAPNTFTSEKVDLQLNALDQEVFVVMGVDIDLSDPELVVGTETVANMSISTTERTTVGGIGQTNVLAHNRIRIQNDGGALVVRGQYSSDSAPSTSLEYLGIIATNDFYLNIDGTGNVGNLSGNARLYGYRAKADAAIFSSLVQSELLSA